MNKVREGRLRDIKARLIEIGSRERPEEG